MKTIYKYAIKVDDTQTIRMPKGAQILSVQCQEEQPCIWAVIDTECSNGYRQFGLVGTGHPCERLEGGKYVGTFQLRQGALVFHLFDFGYTAAVGG
jgi:hypothetical protein